MVAELLDRLQRRLRIVEGHEEHGLHLRFHRQDVLAEPLVVGASQHRLHVELRMHAEIEHRRREHDHVVEMEGIDGAADQRDVAVDAVVVDRLAELRLVRHAPAIVLVAQREIAVESVGRAAGAVLEMVERGVTLHLVLDILADRRPGFDFHMVRVGIDDHQILEVVLLALELAVGENVPRIGRGVNFLDRDLAGRFDAGIHGPVLG